jgi:UDP-glucose 4-epimerase
LNCLVTGGAGFIGSVLVDKLINEGHNVKVIDNESAKENEKFYWNEKADNYKYDICNYDQIYTLFNGVDFVFHLGAQSRIQPSIIDSSYTIKVNCHGTENVLHASKENAVKKVIFSSSSSIYGLKNKLPHLEDMPRDCLNPYAISKVSGEDLCTMYYKLYNLKIVILRYFNVYGERQPTKGDFAPIIGRFLKLNQNKEKLTIVGDGNQKRDYTHVDDVVSANILSIKSNRVGDAEIINIGSGENYSIKDLACMFGSEYEFIPTRKGEAYETLANIDKAENLLNWKPTIFLKDWLAERI